jgi:hypothetical protein
MADWQQSAIFWIIDYWTVAVPSRSSHEVQDISNVFAAHWIFDLPQLHRSGMRATFHIDLPQSDQTKCQTQSKIAPDAVSRLSLQNGTFRYEKSSHSESHRDASTSCIEKNGPLPSAVPFQPRLRRRTTSLTKRF